MRQGGIYLITTADILGHADIKMTMRYAHPTSENMKSAVDKLGKIFITHPNEDQTTKPEKVTSPSFLFN